MGAGGVVPTLDMACGYPVDLVADDEVHRVGTLPRTRQEHVVPACATQPAVGRSARMGMT